MKVKIIKSKPSCFYYDKGLTVIIVGFENGEIAIYRIKTEHNYKAYEEVSK